MHLLLRLAVRRKECHAIVAKTMVIARQVVPFRFARFLGEQDREHTSDGHIIA